MIYLFLRFAMHHEVHRLVEAEIVLMGAVHRGELLTEFCLVLGAPDSHSKIQAVS